MMSGTTLEGLPKPPKGYRPDRDTARPDGLIPFKTAEEAASEDKTRIALLTRTGRQAVAVSSLDAKDLARRIKQGIPSLKPYPTLASKLHSRDLHWLIIGNLWFFVDQHPDWPLRHVTLLPKGMWMSAEAFRTLKPRKLLKRLRLDLKRSGIANHPGFVFAGLDGVFDVNRGGYDLHFHLIVGGEMGEHFDLLRAKPKYKGISPEAAAYGLKDTKRVFVRPIDRATLPHPLTYVVKSHWNHVPTFPTEEGDMKRGAIKRRIPDIYHSQWLLWLDQQKISDLTLCMGITPTKQGFIRTPKNVSMDGGK